MYRLLAPVLLVALAAMSAPAFAQTAAHDSTHADSVAVDTTATVEDPAAAAAADARRDSIDAILTMRARAQASYEEGSNLLQAEDFAGALIRFEDGITVDPRQCRQYLRPSVRTGEPGT
jgi:hypothetical protein